MNDAFLRWTPIVFMGIQIICLPIIAIILEKKVETVITSSKVLDGKIALVLKDHNGDIYAHPSLADLKALENNIVKLTDQVRDLGLKIERITPRRRTDGPFTREE